MLFFSEGARPKKVTEGPGWLRYATARCSHNLWPHHILPNSLQLAVYWR